MMPLPLRSRTSNTLVDLAAVHETCKGTPSLSILKTTPPEASVVEKPLPSMSMTIGDIVVPSGQLQLNSSYPVGSAHRLRNAALRVQGPWKNNPVMHPLEG